MKEPLLPSKVMAWENICFVEGIIQVLITNNLDWIYCKGIEDVTDGMVYVGKTSVMYL